MACDSDSVSPLRDFSADHVAREAVVRGVIGAFYEVYNRLGHGFLELVYSRALEVELRHRELHVEREVPLEVHYKRVLVGTFRADLVVANWLIVELKASPSPHPHDRAQLHNYLRAGRRPSGLLLNFGTEPTFWRITIPSQGRGYASEETANKSEKGVILPIRARPPEHRNQPNERG